MGFFWLLRTEIYSFTVLEARNLNLYHWFEIKVSTVLHCLWMFYGDALLSCFFQVLAAVVISCHACFVATSLQSLLPRSHCLLLFWCQISLL